MQSPRHTRLVYVVPTAPGVGVSSVALGFVRALQAAGVRAGFVKPIADPGVGRDGEDRSVGFARRLFGLDTPAALPMDTAEAMTRSGELDTLLEDVVALVHAVAETADVVVVEGATLDDGHPLVADLDLAVAKALRAEIVPVVPGSVDGGPTLADRIADVTHRFGRDGAAPMGVVVSRAPAGLDEVPDTAAPVLGVVPDEPSLAAPRMADVVEELGFEIVEAGDLAGARLQNVVVAARSPEHLVVRLGPGTLVVTPGDRADVVLTTSFAKATGMPIAGVLLTCGEQLAPELKSFLEPRRAGLNILRTELQTFEAATRLASLDRRVRPDDLERMERLVEHAADHLDVSVLAVAAAVPRSATMTPPMFRHALIREARAAHKRIVLPEGDEPRTLAAAAICARKGIARCVLLGAPDAVRAAATLHGIELPDTVEILDPDVVRERYVAPMVELRKSKGLTPGQAAMQLEDTVVLGTMMLATGDVDGLVSGAVHTTASTVRPALQLIKTAPGSSIVSSVFFMLMPDQVLVYGDCAINPDPSAEELAEIAMQSADSAAAFGIEPRVAMISYSTGSSGTGADVDKVREATRIVRERRPQLAIDGPMQYDAASVESVGRQKAPNSPVAGRANVFVFPDLNTGNTTYKAVQRSAGVVSVGPMLQGLRKPVNDLSRGALVDDIVYTIALTAIQAVTA
ncbi:MULTISPECIES: phosphate acetyltransferase [Rubrivivax]|uniref:Phosphate acetyltransferase n=1 Tax=Rubrivivax benzoatilyticus TaxID=316997 RepID=A0ABX0HUJ1_9BURK|nr:MULTISPECIES: phosphate acetyltransferase [Rubrivivax]MCD0418761.1 phosphate acetyltransferase [Rubrivivax sp. JA1024]EGJ08751.1 phosphate acetyltransferase [Rubrivivax benzoatilyticus JA2 = ATCC BAA-35]MCC9598744.1 phosphate acetyltransferase [Rubrivivax sp. JA1055]NHK97168.1 phosphate acetyltransferase [Rubrivivax benzoatilyticus]NHL23137.1 phosphate acetyltransferase [Rubrivivax benzoatilyticus]